MVAGRGQRALALKMSRSQVSNLRSLLAAEIVFAAAVGHQVSLAADAGHPPQALSSRLLGVDRTAALALVVVTALSAVPAVDACDSARPGFVAHRSCWSESLSARAWDNPRIAVAVAVVLMVGRVRHRVDLGDTSVEGARRVLPPCCACAGRLREQGRMLGLGTRRV